MENAAEIKNLISKAATICVVVQEDEPESLSAALALFYTLKELHKNVNVIAQTLPPKLHFLIPSLDFISFPRDFVISIPKSAANISQIYYEKTDEHVKIHLTADQGRITKEHFQFYYANPKPDLVIALGIQDFKKQLEGRLDSFGFLLGAPIINIDNKQDNARFGAVNIIAQKSLSEIVAETVLAADSQWLTKNAADCLLAGMVIRYENFKSPLTAPQVFQTMGELIRRGADYQRVVNSMHKSTPEEIRFLGKILEHVRNGEKLSVTAIENDEFAEFSENEAANMVEKIKTLGLASDLLVLWKSRPPGPAVKGFFWSQSANAINKFSEQRYGKINNGWVFLTMEDQDINTAKNTITNLI